MTESLATRLRRTIRDVPDFPKPGILFRDITTVLLDGNLVRECLEAMWRPYEGEAQVIAGIESRGFILGASIAAQYSLPFVPLRKPGKLPAATHRESYALEYGTDALEIHQDAVRPGTKVLIVDDLLATGGTASAAARLVEQCGGDVLGLSFLVELADLGGRSRLDGRRVDALLTYE